MLRLSRRSWLQQSLSSLGIVALTHQLASDQRRDVGSARRHVVHMTGESQSSDTPDQSAFRLPAKAKSIIYLYMEGGPSQVDTFDPKPLLTTRDGEPLPFDKPSTVFNSSNKLMASPFRFETHGESGSPVSELFPNIAQCVDDLTFVHSMHHDVSNHSAACYLSHTGDAIAGRPSIGSWVTYGLGSENEDLPAFVVLDCGQAPAGGSQAWSSGFLPAQHAGVKFLRGETAVEFLDPLEPSSTLQQEKLEVIQRLQQLSSDQMPAHQSLEATINNYAQAARMQLAVPELLAIDAESHATRALYGVDQAETEVFGSRCLLARRLVERGVRFVEIFSPRVGADRWDQHGNLEQGHRRNALAVDRPIAGLIRDLKERGLLEETIVVWGGEFGRTPTSQGGNGRDHNPFGYTVFLAGGGFQPGVHYGATDEFGYFAERDKVHLHDLHATLLHQLGIDHERLTYRFGGRDYRLTDVHGRVITPLLAS